MDYTNYFTAYELFKIIVKSYTQSLSSEVIDQTLKSNLIVLKLKVKAPLSLFLFLVKNREDSRLGFNS